MVDRNLSDWVINERKSGFSDEQIKQQLLQAGYPLAEIESLLTNMNDSSDLDSVLKKNGLQIIFYLVVIICSMFLASLFLTVTFFFIPFNFNQFVYYILTGLLSFGVGYLFVYVLKKLNAQFKHYTVTGVIFGFFISINLAFVYALVYISQILQNYFAPISRAGVSGVGMVSMFNLSLNPLVAYLICLLVFVITLNYSFRFDKKKYLGLLWYLIPIGVYLVSTILFKLIIDSLLGSLA